MNCCYRFAEAEGDEIPVLLDNKNFFVPLEAITEMYSLPDYRGSTPTSIFAMFYAVFFGMMLSDAGYGIIMTAGCFAALKNSNLKVTRIRCASCSSLLWHLHCDMGSPVRRMVRRHGFRYLRELSWARR